MTSAPLSRGEAETRITTSLAQDRPACVILVEAPRGMGKTTLLHRLAEHLTDGGTAHAVIDGERLGAGPLELARTVPAAVEQALHPRDVLAGSLPRATHIKETIRQELEKSRSNQAHLLELAFSFPAALSADMKAPLVLLIDDVGEAVRHARHSGLREGLSIVARSLLGSGGDQATAAHPLSVVATLSPVSRAGHFVEAVREHAGSVEHELITLAPMSREEMVQRGIPEGEVDRMMAVTGGRPLWVDQLSALIDRGESLESALTDGLTPPRGILHQECRFEYHMLVGRCRGDAVVRTIMTLLAREDVAGLTQIARYIRTSLPTALDYLFWMLEVAMIRRDGRSYSIADPVMRAWVSVNGPAGVPIPDAVSALVKPSAAEASSSPARRRSAAPERPTPPVPAPPADSPDSLMEID